MIRASAATVISFLFTMTFVASTVRAQVGRADLTLDWMEVLAGTSTPVASPNGILEPGEAARFSVSIAFSPIGTQVPYFPLGTAPVAGFQRTGFGVSPTTVFGGSWDSFGVTGGFLGSLGVPLPDGSLAFCNVRQPLPPVGSSPIATNPLINVWSANWVPPSYAVSQVAFRLNIVFDDYAKLFVFIGNDPGGNPQFGTVEAISTFGQDVQVSIAPSPAGLLVAMALVPWLRRGRRTI